jgi:lysophospholipase L1-like esterase
VPRFLALGDSYTIGEGVPEAERWPNHLSTMLRLRGVPISELLIVARTAWTTDELTDAIAQSEPHGSFDLVSLLIGVNDQYRGRPVSSFTPEFASLIERAKRFAVDHAVERVVVLSIPDWGASPFADGRDRALIGREIDGYNDSARTLTEKAGAHWIDVTGVSRHMLTEQALTASDGLHPSGEMYRRWAELVLPVAIRALAGGAPG